MRGRPRISLSLIRATFCRNPRLDVAATLQTPNRGAERKISSPIDLVPLAGLLELNQIKLLGCQTGAQSNFDPQRFSGVVSNPRLLGSSDSSLYFSPL